MQILYSRCGGIDVHKDSVTVCVLVYFGSAEPDIRRREFATHFKALLNLKMCLLAQKVKGVAPNEDDAWCWSMWRGYLDNDDGILVRKWFEEGGSRAAHIHTSGHASPADLRSFAPAMNAKQLVPIHGVAWDGDTTGFSSIRRLADGEAMAV